MNVYKASKQMWLRENEFQVTPNFAAWRPHTIDKSRGSSGGRTIKIGEGGYVML